MKKKAVARGKLLKRAKKRCHELWSKIVRRRDGKCILCGSTESLNAHHWVVHSAGSVGTRYILANGVTLCYACHIFKVHARGDAFYIDQIKDYMVPKFLSVDDYEEIKRLGRQSMKFELEDILKVEERLKDILDAQA